jgi:hypothetical protein
MLINCLKTRLTLLQTGFSRLALKLTLKKCVKMVEQTLQYLPYY